MSLKSVLAAALGLCLCSSVNAQDPLLYMEGELTADDTRLDDDRPYDEYTLELEEGDAIAVEISSYDFDTFLIVETPDGETHENDDFGGSTRVSRVEFVAQSSGTYLIHATCYDASESGDYEVRADAIESHPGELAAGDETEPDGSYVDWYEIECPAGQTIRAEVSSDDIDTYLIVEAPDQSRDVNDDFKAGSTNSRVETNTFLAGTFRIGVSSYEAGETGAYDLIISLGAGYVPTPIAGSQEVEAEFDGAEATLTDHGFVEGYSFQVQAGATVIIDMMSADVDTFLKLRWPDGHTEENDDHVPGNTNSRLAFRVDEAGTYYLTATTFGVDEIGDYSISIDLNASKYEAGDWAVGEQGQVYGVFVGIADDGENEPLPYCDEDARRLSEAFAANFNMAANGNVLLMNESATVFAIEDALADVVDRAGPEDMVVFFYSGHGNQLKDNNGDFADPDGFDESLAVYGGELLDDRFAELFADCQARTALVVLDSCYSGGFARDFVSQGGRVGLFSSEGDCLSMTAEELEAGGYLSRFFLDGIADHRDDADYNDDEMLTLHEITFYVQTRFVEVLAEQRIGTPSRLFPTGEIDPNENFAFQRVICDRDASAPNLILMDWK